MTGPDAPPARASASVPVTAKPEPAPQRTNPLGVLAQGITGLRSLAFPAAAGFFSTRNSESWVLAASLILAALLLFAMGGAYLRWLRFTYTVGADDIRVESGLFARTARSVPYERIQDVSLEQAFVPRLLGLTAVRFETGAGGGEEIALTYLTEAEGARLRELVRDRREVVVSDATATGTAAPAAEPPAEILFRMTPQRLLLFGLFNFSLAVVAVLAGLTQQFDVLLPFELWDFDAWEARLAGPGAQLAGLGPLAQVAGGVIALASLLVVGFATGVIRTVARDWDFLLERTAKGFRRRRGLFTRTDVVMPVHRVQALKITTGAIRRRFGAGGGWHGLKLVSLAQDAGSASHDVAPFAQLAELDPIIRAAGFMPATGADWHRPSRRYRFDSALFDFVSIAAIAIPVAVFAPPGWALLPLALAIAAAMVSAWAWRFEKNAVSDTQLFAQEGYFSPELSIASRIKLQSSEIVRGPVAQRRGYAHLKLGLAGGTLALNGLPLARAEALHHAVIRSITANDFSELA